MTHHPATSAAAVASAGERLKELDFEHRGRERSVARVTLSFGLLRRVCRRWWAGTKPAAAAPVPHPAVGTLAMTFVGHCTVMITTPGVRLLTDPVLENSLRGLRRARAAAIDNADLGDISLVLLSQSHRDHLSRRTLARLPRSATVIVPRGCGSLLADLGFSKVVELEVGQTFPLADVEVTSVPARHGGGRGGLFGTGNRRCANGYVIQTQGRAIYFAGDTGYFAGFSDIGRRFAPDVALLPIAGYQPAPFRREHLSPLDAVYAFEDLRARILIPIAHGSFPLGYEPMAEPLAWLKELSTERKLSPTILEHGQTCLLR